MTDGFLGVDDPCCEPETAPVYVLPVPYEGTVTYGKGAAQGPQAIIDASRHIETYDEYLGKETYRQGIATLPPLDTTGTPDQVVSRLRDQVLAYIKNERHVVTLGGEHSIAAGAIAAYVEAHPDIGIVQFDAHADLREQYEDSRWNHACTMARVHDVVAADRIVQLGIRSMSAEEAERIATRGCSVHHWHDMALDLSESLKAIERLPETVYVTFDVDAFAPAVVRATGTPEPGGLDWLMTMRLLEGIASSKRVLGFDVTELTGGDAVSAFTVARLVYRMIGLFALGGGVNRPDGSRPSLEGICRLRRTTAPNP